MQAPKRDGTRCPKGRRFLLACHTRCTRSTETTRNSVTVKHRIKVMKLMESQISLEVNVTGQGSECYLTFVSGSIHIAT